MVIFLNKFIGKGGLRIPKLLKICVTFLWAVSFCTVSSIALAAWPNGAPEDDTVLGLPTGRQIDCNGELINPDVLNPLEGGYTFELTPKTSSESVYVSLPAAVLAGVSLENPNFNIGIEAPFGLYMFSAAIADSLEELDKNDLRQASFRITLTDKSADAPLLEFFSKSLPNAKAISAFVEFKLELIDSESKDILMPIGDLVGPMEQLLPVSGSEFPLYYGVFRYDESQKGFAYAPHLARYFDDDPYASVALTGSGIYVAAENSLSFSDVPSTAWYAGTVKKAAAKLLVQGVGDNKYQPERAVTRAEFTQMIANALLLPEASVAPYADVSAGQWYYSAIARAYDMGLLEKFKDKNFYPNQPITREEMAVILGAILRLCGMTTNASLGHFTDSADMNSDYRLDIALVFDTGLMQGTSYDKFDPKGVTTRAQAATVQIRLLETLNMIDK